MHKTLLALVIGAGVFAAPAFAQVIPDSTGAGSAQVGASAPGMDANASAGVGMGTAMPTTGASGTQPMGLGGLLRQTQARDAEPVADAPTEGAGPTGDLNAKARAKLRAAAHGH